MTSRDENLQSVGESKEYAPGTDDNNSSRDLDCEGSEPVICSKCNVTFETDSQYIQHYDQIHDLNNQNHNLR
jgi:hypothetical protein